MASTTFTVEAMVRGYHVYRAVWDASSEEELLCERELGNPHNPYAVAIARAGVTVGHVPRKISSVCSLFLRRGGSIRCQVTGSRRFSQDLPQGGLEIPCELIFEGSAKEVRKAEKLVRATLNSAAPTVQQDPGASNDKKRALSADEKSEETDVLVILEGKKLSDRHIHRAQCLIKQQFPKLKGLQSTLLQSNKRTCRRVSQTGEAQIQVIHTRGDHWIVACSVGCADGEVNVYDSVYSKVDGATQQVILNLFHPRTTIKVVNAQKQEGGADCGLFALANAAAIAHGVDPTTIRFKQEAMRAHLAKCFKENKLTLFPTV